MTTKSHIVDAVAGRLREPQSKVKAIVDAAFQHLGAHLVAGEKVSIDGLGVFDVKPTAPRKGRNPRTGESIDIPAGKKVTFKLASDLKAKL